MNSYGDDVKANFKTTDLDYENLVKFASNNNIPISVFEYKNLEGSPNDALSVLTKRTGSYIHQVVYDNIRLLELENMIQFFIDYINTGKSPVLEGDTDGDGLTDAHEELIKSGGALDTFYQPIMLINADYLDPNKADSDYLSDDFKDNLKDGEEIIYLDNLGVFYFLSDPTSHDTDKDEYYDNVDPYPNSALGGTRVGNDPYKTVDIIFEKTDTFQLLHESSAVDFAKVTAERNIENRKHKPTFENLITLLKVGTLAGSADPYSALAWYELLPDISSYFSNDEIQKVITYAYNSQNNSPIIKVRGLPNFANGLMTYVYNKDINLVKNLDVDKVLTKSGLARDSFRDNINLVAEFVEYNLSEQNNVLNFSTKYEQDGYLYGIKSPNPLEDDKYGVMDYVEFISESIDWTFTLGNCQAMLSSSAKIKNDGKYSMTLRYNIADFYDYTAGDGGIFIIDSAELEDLAFAGISAPYTRTGTDGYIELEIEWNKGQRGFSYFGGKFNSFKMF